MQVPPIPVQPEKSKKVQKDGFTSRVGKYWWRWRLFASRHNTKILLAWMATMLFTVKVMTDEKLRDKLKINSK